MRSVPLILIAALLITGPWALAGGVDVTYMESTSECDDGSGAGNETEPRAGASTQGTALAVSDGNGTDEPTEDNGTEDNSTEDNSTDPPPDSGSGHWSYSETERCEEETTYLAATAADDQGELASVAATGRSWDEATWTYESWYSWYHDPANDEDWYSEQSRSSSSESEGWERSVSASTTVADAEASRGCSESYESHSWYQSDGYHGPNSSHRWSSYRDSSSWGSGCHDTVSVDHAGRSASGGWVSGCQGTGQGDGWSYDSYDEGQAYGASSHWQTDQDTCRSGVATDSPAGQTFAGWTSECDRWYHAYDRWSYDGEYRAEGWYDQEHRCFDGALVEGPTDLSARAGARSTHAESCHWSDTPGNETDGNETDGYEESCWSSDDRELGGELDWEGNPAGPLHVGLWRSLPGPGWE